MAAGALFGAAAARGLVRLVKQYGDYADAIQDVSDRTGFAATSVQELQFSFIAAGASADETNGILDRFNRTLGEVATGRGRGFSALQIFDPNLLRQLQGPGSVEEKFQLVIARIRELPTHAEKLALAIATFGEQGARKVLLVAESLDTLRQRARDLGIIISNQEIAKAGELGDRIELVSHALRVKLMAAAAPLLPVFTDLAEAVLDFANEHEVFDKMADAIKRLADSIASVDTKKLKDMVQSGANQASGAGISLERAAAVRSLGSLPSGAANSARMYAYRDILNPEVRKSFDQLAFIAKETGVSLSEVDANAAKLFPRFVQLEKVSSPLAAGFARVVAFLEPLLTGFGSLVKAVPILGGLFTAATGVLRFFTVKVQAIIAVVVGAFQGVIDIVNAFGGTTYSLSGALKGLWDVVSRGLSWLGSLFFALADLTRAFVNAAGAIAAAATLQFDTAKKLAANAEAAGRSALSRPGDAWNAGANAGRERMANALGAQAIANWAPEAPAPGATGGNGAGLQNKQDADLKTANAKAAAAEKEAKFQELIRKDLEEQNRIKDQMVSFWVSSLETEERLNEAIRQSQHQIALSRRGITDEQRAQLQLAFDIKTVEIEHARELALLEDQIRIAMGHQNDELVRQLENTRLLMETARQRQVQALQAQNAQENPEDFLGRLAKGFEQNIDLSKILSEQMQSGISGVVDTLFALGDATGSAGEKFKEFAKGFIQQVGKMIIQMLILLAIQKALGWASGAIGGTGFAGGSAVAGGSFPAFATGGFAQPGFAMVGERGRELIQIPKPGGLIYSNAKTERMMRAAPAAAPVSVNIFNQSNAAVSQQRRADGGLDVYIKDVIARDFASGGPVSRAADRSSGAIRR